MATYRYVLLSDHEPTFVEMPATHAYQLTALLHRLHKEIGKLTADGVPQLPRALAECDNVELTGNGGRIVNGLDYVRQLEQDFARIREKETAYPLVSLLTEIRALFAQLEQWYEEEAGA
jgi:hypothetical protein